MRILIACECSGVIREAFAARGHDAWSCDIKPCEVGGRQHIQGDVFERLDDGWDCMIAHPECTHIASSGAAHFAKKRADGRQQSAIDNFMRFVDAKIEKKAIENPVGIMSTKYRKPDQIIQPYQFGHCESKATCLWLTNLPKLIPTKIVEPAYYMNAPNLFEPEGSVYRDKKGKRYSATHYLSGRVQRRYLNQTPSGQNRLGPSDDRSTIRSRTYPGIALAMAEQWG